MKIVLIGNMNNNNFSIMRYLRDMGVDAHLILMKNDITKSQTHFAPEYDTWEIEKWKPYIHYLNFKDWQAALFYPGFLLKKYLKGYDIYIGSNFTPVLLKRAGIDADIFYPFGTGIEGIGDPSSRSDWNDLSIIKKEINKYFRRLKISALKKTKVCLTSELTLSKQTYDELNIPFQKISIPMVYNNENVKISQLSALEQILNTIKKTNISIFCHVSHMPYKDVKPMIYGFYKYLQNVNNDTKLFFLNYGLNTHQTKNIISKLNISDNVIWLPKMARKEIMIILKHVNWGFSEFNNRFWGGTGWEFLASGVPFFHWYDITTEKYQKEYNTPMPSFINTNDPDVICEHLIKYIENPEPYKEMGRKGKEWFEKYGGIGLAKKWKDIIIEIYNEKNKPN